MGINGITTNLIKNKGIDFISQLANNSDSIAPMFVKDALSNSATVYTYSKEGGKDDAREKAIEGYLTGAVWLLMIPAVKKIINKTIYPLLKLNPNLDTGLIITPKDIAQEATRNAKLEKANPVVKFVSNFLHDGINKKTVKDIQDNFIKNSQNSALTEEKQVLSTLNDQNSVIKDFVKKHKLSENIIPTNAQLYKSLKVGRFLVSTGLAALALIEIIKYKQKTTEERIKKDVKKKNNASKVLINKNLNNENLHQAFTSKTGNKNLSFTGLGAFMTNPILNTLILDGVITSTRLAEARKGEKKEVGLKEAFQIFFIYGLAKPIQSAFEGIGKNILKLPIALDPKVLFEKGLDTKISDALPKINEIKESGKDVLKAIYETDPKHSLIELLEKNGTLKTVEKDGNKAISMLSPIKEKDILKSFSDIEDLSKHIENLKAIKGYKVFSVIANVLIAVWAMGVLQPKAVIFMRKLLNDGDNRNPAIVALEKEIHKNSDETKPQ